MRYATLAVLVFMLIACQRQKNVDVAQSGGPATTTTPPSASVASGTVAAERDDPGSRPTLAGAAQEVHLIEYQIHLPDSLPAGKVTFNVENGGKEGHGFEIEGNGIEEKTDILRSGDSAALQVDLRPGTYTVYCPVKGHKGKGMQRTLVVK
jgi:plastocyanin